MLGAREGQTLTVSIRSNNGKVKVTLPNGGGTTYDSYETVSGDNYIGVYNSGGSTSFSLTVSIR